MIDAKILHSISNYTNHIETKAIKQLYMILCQCAIEGKYQAIFCINEDYIADYSNIFYIEKLFDHLAIITITLPILGYTIKLSKSEQLLLVNWEKNIDINYNKICQKIK